MSPPHLIPLTQCRSRECLFVDEKRQRNAGSRNRDPALLEDDFSVLDSCVFAVFDCWSCEDGAWTSSIRILLVAVERVRRK